MVAVGRLLTTEAAPMPSKGAVPVPSAWRPGAVQPPGADTQSPLIVDVDGTPAAPSDAYTARAVALFLAGQGLGEVVAALHPEIDVKSGGRPYREKRAAVETLIRDELLRLRAGQ
jgi:hypothetical protein